MSAFDADVDVLVEAEPGGGPLDTGLTYPVDLSNFVRGAEWTRGRPWLQANFPAGLGKIIFDNSDGRFYSFDTASPYSPDLKVGMPIRIRAVHNAITYAQIEGYVETWSSPFPTEREELITIPFVETFARLVRKTIRADFIEELTHERIGAILDEAGWPAAKRTLDTGVAEVAALTDIESTAEFRLVETAIAEQGDLFQAKNGNIRFRNRVANSGVVAASTFGPSGSDLTYVDVTYEDDEALLFNEARVTAETGDQGVAIDATSVAEHGPISYPPIDSVDIKDATNALNVAEWIVGRNANVTKRITGLTIDPGGDPDNLWPEVLGRELRDAITVKIAFPGASMTFEQLVSVEQIHHKFDMVSGVWTVSYNLHPISAFESQDFWILGTSQLGIDTVLA